MINSSKTRSENQEQLDNYRKKFEEIKNKAENDLEEDTDWYLLNNEYPELVEELISDLESYVKREEELFNIENHILWIDYRDYKFKIYLDAERNTLVGDVLLNDEIDVIGLESDSITHLITEMERAVDNQINYQYQSQLAEENIKLRDWAKLFNCEYPFKFGE
jgi:hypothetical protein